MPPLIDVPPGVDRPLPLATSQYKFYFSEFRGGAPANFDSFYLKVNKFCHQFCKYNKLLCMHSLLHIYQIYFKFCFGKIFGEETSIYDFEANT